MTKEEEKLLKLMGNRIRNLRLKAGYTSQEAFAYEAEIPRAQYGRYEAGTNITLLSLNKILKFHKLSLEAFFSEGFEKIK
jgi:transcriptional regulator with XRE-family HTH domain